MISLTIARKYARALLEIGLHEKNFEDLGKELEKMAQALRSNKDLRIVLVSPHFPVPKQKAIGREICNSLALSKPVVDFIDLLIERKRMDHFPEIIKSYNRLCDEASQRIRATLITASDISPVLVNSIQGQLELSTGKKVILTVGKDPSLIGGVMTQIGNVIYNGSLKTQLLKVRENLLKE